MKKKLIYSVSLIIILTIFSSCTKDTSIPTPDPSGTITTTLVSGSDFALYSDLASDGLYNVYNGSYPYVRVRLGFSYSSLTTFFQIDISKTSVFTYGEYVTNGDAGGEAANIGAINGLGDITDKPTSGFINHCTMEKGHGYVVRYRKSRDVYNSALPYFYYRFYVVDWLTTAGTGGVNGAIVKIQGPF